MEKTTRLSPAQPKNLWPMREGRRVPLAELSLTELRLIEEDLDDAGYVSPGVFNQAVDFVPETRLEAEAQADILASPISVDLGFVEDELARRKTQ